MSLPCHLEANLQWKSCQFNGKILNVYLVGGNILLSTLSQLQGSEVLYRNHTIIGFSGLFPKEMELNVFLQVLSVPHFLSNSWIY